MFTRVVDDYEDFGWRIEAESAARLHQINRGAGGLDRRLGRSDETGRRRFSERLPAVLLGEPAISNVRWHVGAWSDSGWGDAPGAEPGAAADLA